ncbi:hypothetical protein Btru_075200 [Bulinus truncatus]|nr:hypothetical protein Btru_075200 [Bulinus truncatus]
MKTFAVNKKFDDFVLTTRELIKFQNTCDLHELPLPPSRNFLLVKNDMAIVSSFSPFLCPDNFAGKFGSDNGAGNCETLLDTCSEVGRIFIQNHNCTPKLFDLSTENTYITCLFSQRELDTDKANMLHVGTKNFSLFSVSIDLHQDVLILKQYKKRGFSQIHDLETFRFVRKSTCVYSHIILHNQPAITHTSPLPPSFPAEDRCQFPKYFQGKWFGSRNPTLEVDQTVFTSTMIERTNCSESLCPTKLSKPTLYECVFNIEKHYIMRSKTIITRQNDLSIFTCITTAQFTDNKLIYYVTQKDYNQRLQSYSSVLLNRPSLSTLRSVCQLQPPYTLAHFGILIKQDKVKESTDKCPDVFSSAYEFRSPTCNFYLVLKKARTQIQIVTKECGDRIPLFTEQGYLTCVHNEKIDNVTFLILFNLDHQVDYTTTYKFVCLIYTFESAHLNIMSIPQVCDEKHSYGPPNNSHTFIGTSVESEEVEAYLEPQWSLYDAIYISMLITGCILVFSFIACQKLKKKADIEENFDDEKPDVIYLGRRRGIVDQSDVSEMSIMNSELNFIDAYKPVKETKERIPSFDASVDGDSDESKEDDDDDDGDDDDDDDDEGDSD